MCCLRRKTLTTKKRGYNKKSSKKIANGLSKYTSLLDLEVGLPFLDRLAKDLVALMKPLAQTALSCDALSVKRLDIRMKLQSIEIELSEVRLSLRTKKQEHDR